MNGQNELSLLDLGKKYNKKKKIWKFPKSVIELMNIIAGYGPQSSQQIHPTLLQPITANRRKRERSHGRSVQNIRILNNKKKLQKVT